MRLPGVGETVRVAGTRLTLHRSLTSKNEWMAFLTLEDLEGMLDVVLFPDAYRRARAVLSGPSAPLVIEGTIERDENTGDPVLQGRKVWNLR